MHSTPLRSAALAALLTLAPAAYGQLQAEPGFAATTTVAAPSTFGAHATLSDGRRFSFDGQNFQIFDAAGNLLETLGSLPESTFSSFAILDPTETFALCGESSNSEVLRVPLDGSPFSVVTTLVFNFDAEFDPTDSNIVWISAATGGFGNGNEIVRVELDTGMTTTIAQVSGPSGPIALDADGDLYYVPQSDAFPTEPDSLQLVTWSQAQLNGGTVLDESDATLVLDELDGGSSLEFGPVFGNLYLSENSALGTARVLEINPNTGEILDVVASTGNFLSKLEFRTVGGTGTFHAYQPLGVELLARESDFTNFTSDITTFEPRRPVAMLSGPTSGPTAKTLMVTGAEPNSAILVMWGSVDDQLATETTIDIGFGAPFHTILPPGLIRRQRFLTPTDANGTAMWSYFDPGNLHGTFVFQTLVRGSENGFEGSSTFVNN